MRPGDRRSRLRRLTREEIPRALSEVLPHEAVDEEVCGAVEANQEVTHVDHILDHERPERLRKKSFTSLYHFIMRIFEEHTVKNHPPTSHKCLLTTQKQPEKKNLARPPFFLGDFSKW